jgi:hypothetical protein
VSPVRIYSRVLYLNWLPPASQASNPRKLLNDMQTPSINPLRIASEVTMRALRLLNVAILSGLVGSAALLYAQDEKPQDDKPAQQEEAKPQPKQDEAKPAKQDKEQEKQDKKRDQDQMKPGGQEHPAQQAQGARPAGKGGHIPDDKFKSNFGRGHHFRAQGVIVQGQPQFHYGGYSFELVDAWPVGWAYTDDCYIDYIDGEYFLFDLLHPGVRIAIVVML